MSSCLIREVLKDRNGKQATVLYVTDLINKAQTSKEGPVEGPEYGVAHTSPSTTSENELPFGWYTKNEAFIKPRDSRL